MPRGSRPGERRGGRKKGTPNKATLLKNAIVRAATTADPSHSPLDIFLRLMRDQEAPLELRITMAQRALPFMHARPKERVPDRVVSRRHKHGGSADGLNAGRGSVVSSGPRVRIIPGIPKAAANDADPSATPLGFLLHLMQAADTPTDLRLRAATIVAPYVHARSTQEAQSKARVEDQYGFAIDLDAAKAIRELTAQLAKLPAPSPPLTPHLEVAAEASDDPQRAAIEGRIAGLVKSFGCPPGYRHADIAADERRARVLADKRHEGLTPEEDDEEAIVIARMAAYDATPKGQERSKAIERRKDLAYRIRYTRDLTPEEDGEYEDLCRLYPPDPDVAEITDDDLPPVPDRSWLLQGMAPNDRPPSPRRAPPTR